MKDFVRDVWKIAAACASGAFLLSLVIGLIAGNPFGIAFFRALLFGILFTASASACGSSCGRISPSPAPARGRDADASTEPRAAQRGTAVDIVLPEDDSLHRQAYSGTSQPSRASRANPVKGNPWKSWRRIAGR